MKPRLCFTLLAGSLASVGSAQEWVNGVRFLPQRELASYLVEQGDVENDGDIDLVRLCEGGSCLEPGFQVILNGGDGSYSEGPLIALDNQSFAYERDLLRVGDVTGDGLADVALVYGTPFSASSPGGVFLFPGLGGGDFDAPIGFATPSRPKDIELGDVDDNGVLDLIEMHTDGANNTVVTWYVWNGSGWSAGPALTLGPNTNGTGDFSGLTLEVLDLGEDGIADAALSEAQNASVWTLPTLGGGASLGVEIALPGAITGEPPIYLRGGDLDGDGKRDLFAWGTFNSGNPFQPFDTILYPILNLGGGSLAVSGRQYITEYFPPTNREARTLMHIVDWDGDGDGDLASMANLQGTRNGLPSGAGFFLWENDGAHHFELAAGSYAVSFDQAAPGPADYNLDGLADFATPDGIRFGNGTFTDVQILLGGSGADPELTRDIEDDGDIDLVSLGGGIVFENDGAGGLERTVVWPALQAPFVLDETVGLADLTGDGREEYLVGLFESVPFTQEFIDMRLLLDDGFGNYSFGPRAAPPGVQIPSAESAPRPIVDLDKDGDLDLVVEDGFWENEGSGFFRDFTPLFTGRPADAADLDTNGFVDLLTFDSATSTLALQFSQGNGAFTPATLLVDPDLHFQAKFLDADSDGDLDVFAGTESTSSDVFLIENTGGAFGSPAIVLTGYPASGNNAFVDDYDGDGVGDLVVTAWTASVGRIFVYPRTAGTLLFDEPRVFFARSGVKSAGDLDGDGDLDLFGDRIHCGWRHNGPDAGSYRQFGQGLAGSGGIVPILGASGPLRPGSTTAALHVRRGRGGSLFAMQRARIPAAKLAFQVPELFGGVFLLSGPAGQPGAGELDLPFPVGASLAGQTIAIMGQVWDPAAADGAARTNRLLMSFGF